MDNEITKSQEIRMYTQLTTLSVLQGDCANALLVVENMRRISIEIPDWSVEYGYNYLMALANMHNGNLKSAQERLKSTARLFRLMLYPTSTTDFPWCPLILSVMYSDTSLSTKTRTFM